MTYVHVAFIYGGRAVCTTLGGTALVGSHGFHLTMFALFIFQRNFFRTFTPIRKKRVSVNKLSLIERFV